MRPSECKPKCKHQARLPAGLSAFKPNHSTAPAVVCSRPMNYRRVASSASSGEQQELLTYVT